MTFWQKLSSAAHLVVRGSLPAEWFDRPGLSYTGGADTMREPMRQSAWVMRAIKLISGPISSLPIEWSPQRTGGDPVEQSPEVTDYWAAPAIGLAWEDVVEATVGWLKLEGEAFWILDDSALVPFPEARTVLPRFILARPDRMILIKQAGQITGWSYLDADGRSHALLPDQVIHLKFWNPYNEDRGLPEFDACETAADADYMAGVFNLRLQQNNGDQGVYIVAKGGLPDDAQRQQITRQLQEKRARQQAGEFRPVFLSGDITIEDPKVRVPDTAALTARLQNREEIAVALGVPPSLFQIQASYSIGSASDRYRLREDACVPIARKLSAAMDELQFRTTRQRLYSRFNWRVDSVMQQVQRELVDPALKLWSAGIPMRTVSDYLNLGLPKFDGDEIGYLPFSVAPVGTAPVDQQFSETPTPTEEESSPEDDAEDAVEEAKAALLSRIGARASSPAYDPTHTECAHCGCVVKAGANPEWATHMARRREVVRLYESKLGRVLAEARRETLRKIESQSAKALQTRAAAADLIFDFPAFKNALSVQMRSAARSALQIAGEQLWAEIQRSDPFKYPDPEALKFIAQRENKISGCADDIFGTIQKTLQDGLDGGDTMSELADRVRAKFNQIDKGRAQRIAMTETAAAYGQSRDVAMKMGGVTTKAWLTSGLDNVRPFHLQAGRDYTRDTAIPLNESFYVGGEWLRFPGDPNGRADNVINCHCVQIAVAAQTIETDSASAIIPEAPISQTPDPRPQTQT